MVQTHERYLRMKISEQCREITENWRQRKLAQNILPESSQINLLKTPPTYTQGRIHPY
jgi:hypothetical protein